MVHQPIELVLRLLFDLFARVYPQSIHCLHSGGDGALDGAFELGDGSISASQRIFIDLLVLRQQPYLLLQVSYDL